MVEVFEEIKSGDDSKGSVYLNRCGKPLRKLTNQFSLALMNAGIEDFRFHDLRHTFASHFIMSGGDLLSLKEILGHKSLSMVQRYAHLASSHKRNLTNNLNHLSIPRSESDLNESIQLRSHLSNLNFK